MNWKDARLDKLLVSHETIFSIFCLIMAFFCPPVSNSMTNFTQDMLFCISLVTIFGIAHGSLDYLRIDCAWYSDQSGVCKQSSGVQIRYLLIPLYFSGALVFFGAWMVAPALALVSFLFLSVLHFGEREGFILQPIRTLKSMNVEDRLRLAAAGLPVLLPCGFKAEAVRPIIEVLMFDGASRNTLVVGCILVLLKASAFVWLLLTLFCVYQVLTGGVQGRESVSKLVLIACMSFLLLKVSPLTAFTIYFCGYHAASESIKLSHALSRGDGMLRGLIRFILLSAPPTIITVVSGYFFFCSLAESGISMSASLARVLFVTISCITVPHFFIRCGLASTVTAVLSERQRRVVKETT